MPMVEGIGDEVLQVLGIFIVIFLFVTAWKSTAIRELPQIRAVFILDRRSQPVFNNDAVQTPSAPPDPGETSNSDVNVESTATPSEVDENIIQNSTDKQSVPENDVNALRLSYFSHLQTQLPSTSASGDSHELPDTCNPTVNEESVGSDNGEDSIRIKLKYLNDEQRSVNANLQERLGEFRRRCFALELSNNKSVLLIFQGRVLGEEETLAGIGLYDNCVVHCLVKSGRNNNAEARGAAASSGNNTPADWNLGPLLLALLVAMFALAWFSYWTYPQLFGITSTILLACLTTIFILAVASLYYPHVFQAL